MNRQHSYNRRQGLKVVDGKTQRKNNWELTPNYLTVRPAKLLVEKLDPGRGYRHVVSRRDILKFVEIIPDWNVLARGLRAIFLAHGDWNAAGYYCSAGVIELCAWDDDPWRTWDARFYYEHAEVLARLNVPCEKDADGDFVCKFNDDTIRAWQLLHIFLHELGHHHDRMNTRSKVRSAHGEKYAEAYALKQEPLVWDRYRDVFDF